MMTWKPAVAALMLLAAAAAVYSGEPRQRSKVDTGPGSLTAARKYLEGRWGLESFEVRPPGKPPIQLKGSGVLNYDDFGNLTMEIRADQATSDLLRAAGIEIRDGVIQNPAILSFQGRDPKHPHWPLAT